MVNTVNVAGTNLVVPHVHMNGTSRSELLAALMTASQALTDALDALGEAAPNMRDYYPQGDAAWTAAQEQHKHRVSRVRAVKVELQAIGEAVADARFATGWPTK